MSKRLNYSQNLLKWRVGCFNIDATRVGGKNGRFCANLILSHTSDCEYIGVEKLKEGKEDTITDCGLGTAILAQYDGRKTLPTQNKIKSKRNIGEETISKYSCSPDCPCRLMDEQAPNAGAMAVVPEKERTNKKTNCYGEYQSRGNKDQKLDGLGGTSRFFLQILDDEVEV